MELVWVIHACISSTVLVLTAGRLSDLLGRRTAFVGAFAIFGLASLGRRHLGSQPSPTRRR